jgi:hypothetical protein
LFLERRLRGGAFSKLHVFTKPFASNLYYADPNVDVQKNIYEYRLTSKDICENHISVSNISYNILMEVDGSNIPINSITYQDYGNWPSGVQQYQILFSPGLNSINSSTWNSIYASAIPESHQDVREVTPQIPELCYCIRAIENGPNSLGRTDTSYSNRQCVLFDPSVFFPTAIQINGYNNYFTPVGAHIDLEKSQLEIFSRWGQLVHRSDLSNNGWDAKGPNGEYVNEGVYVYHATIIGKNGLVKKYSGTLSVLK